MKRIFFITVLLVLTACSALPGGSTPTPLPTVVLDDSTPMPGSSVAGSVVTASGVAAPAETAELVFTSSGRVKAVHVALGQQVQAGEVLAELEGQESLQAAVSAAEFELAQAEQALQDLNNDVENQRVQAMQNIVTYEQAVKTAQYALDNFTVPSDQTGMDAVAGLNMAKQRLDAARAAFEPVKNLPSGNQQRKDLKERLDEAQASYNAAVRRLQLEYDLDVAHTRLARAQEDYATLTNGPDPAQLRLAEARKQNAETQVQAAKAALVYNTLTAPFDGAVSRLSIHPGEWVIPGQKVLALADITHLRIETTDLSERDVPQVKVGQAAVVFIKALNLEVTGKVASIAPLAETLGGDVVYRAVIELETAPEGLRPGMSVEVRFTGG